ncbi:LOW QUALITY PROTEIN: hypothetical protein OSB04_010190 [Centaurea solstitialis]|uniref:SWIM-type domain-containing protein n=1 Tax=Centaurea solstitialis TaxID=347529 RepID=A0AA38WP36_9ASTR|nr:LOW QUALITY PROTEIN: hypothetical protein OSB04_010190 [Centaurea solstitialis]
MSSEIHKVRVKISYGGTWQQRNEEWHFVTEIPVHHLLVPINVTYSRFVRTIERKCGIDPFVFVTRIACMDAGRRGVYILWSDQDITEFLEDAAKEDDVPTLYVYDDSPICSGGNVGSDVNTEGDANVVETEEPQEEEDVEGDEEEEEDPLHFDNYVFDTSTLDDEETRREAYFVRSFPGNDDFHHMPPSSLGQKTFTPNQPIPYNRRGRVKQNQVFRSKPEMTLALGMKFLEEGFEFKTLRSSNSRYEAVCVHDNWRIYATPIGRSEMFQVRMLNDVHTCSRMQMHPAHRQATRRVLAHLLLDKTGDISRTIRGCDIVRDIKTRYKIDISYWQAWRAKWRALCMIEGNLAESFTRLPQYFYNVELNNPDTVTDITIDVTGRFASCFFALGCAINTFRSQMLRKVLIIDCAHLKGDYLGTMFLAVAMDANNQVVPIAIGVAKSESGDSCTYFFQMLRRCIGEMEGLVFMTDRSGPLSQAINTVYPTAYHAYCCHHLYMNIKAKDASVQYNTCRAYTTYEFDLHMVNPNRWSRAHFPGLCYNIMTSNYVECMNAHSRFAQKGAIVGLMEYFRAFQQEWYSKRREVAARLTNTLTPWAEVRVQKRAIESASWIVRDIGYGEYEVQDGYRDAKVQYYDKSCSCKRWQLSGLPCGHAIAVAAHQNLTDCSHLASPYFTVENLKATWAPVVYPVGPQLAWVSPDFPLMTVRPPILRTGPGRKSKHKRFPSRDEGSGLQRCSRCEQYRHSRNQCTEILPSQRLFGSRQAEATTTQQMDDNSLPSQRTSGSRQVEATTTQQSSRHYSFDLNDDLNIDLNY